MNQRLRAVIPAARLAPYLRGATVQHADAIKLYRWNSVLSLALFDDVSNVEFVMRTQMSHHLSGDHGADWFRRADLFDDGAAKAMSAAWDQGRLQKLVERGAPPDVVHGTFVASLTFGFWVKLLGRGSFAGRQPMRTRRFYDDALWKPTLSKAFPNVGHLERSKVERAAEDVLKIRNRITHHEHVIWGTPAYGQRNQDGSPRRIGVRSAHATLLDLAGYLNHDLSSWLTANSGVPALLAGCPLADTSRLLL